ncbi:MAG: carboxypeptidase-like regulatory domain-containing protein [Spirochaetota bacterium]
MKWIGRAVVAMLALGACASGPGFVDSRGSPLHWIVYDGSGSALPGAAVRIETLDTNDDASAISSDVRGRFVVPHVAHGRVAITAEKAGYESARTEALLLDATQIVYLRLRSAADVAAEAQRLFTAGRPETAVATAMRALEIDPQNSTVRYTCAAIAAQAGAYEEARTMLAWFPRTEPPRAVALLREYIDREENE